MYYKNLEKRVGRYLKTYAGGFMISSDVSMDGWTKSLTTHFGPFCHDNIGNAFFSPSMHQMSKFPEIKRNLQ